MKEKFCGIDKVLEKRLDLRKCKKSMDLEN